MPWEVIDKYTRQFFRAYLGMIALQLYYFSVVIRNAMGKEPFCYNSQIGVLSIADTLNYVMIDVQAWRATGMLLVWPLNPTPLINAFICMFIFRKGVFSKPGWLVAVNFARGFSHSACILYFKPSLLLTSAAAAYHVQLVGLLVAIALIPSRHAKMLAAFKERKAKAAKKMD